MDSSSCNNQNGGDCTPKTSDATVMSFTLNDAEDGLEICWLKSAGTAADLPQEAVCAVPHQLDANGAALCTLKTDQPASSDATKVVCALDSDSDPAELTPFAPGTDQSTYSPRFVENTAGALIFPITSAFGTDNVDVSDLYVIDREHGEGAYNPINSAVFFAYDEVLCSASTGSTYTFSVPSSNPWTPVLVGSLTAGDYRFTLTSGCLAWVPSAGAMSTYGHVFGSTGGFKLTDSSGTPLPINDVHGNALGFLPGVPVSASGNVVTSTQCDSLLVNEQVLISVDFTMTSSGGAVPIYVDLIANGVSAVTGSVSFKIEPLSCTHVDKLRECSCNASTCESADPSQPSWSSTSDNDCNGQSFGLIPSPVWTNKLDGTSVQNDDFAGLGLSHDSTASDASDFLDIAPRQVEFFFKKRYASAYRYGADFKVDVLVIPVNMPPTVAITAPRARYVESNATSASVTADTCNTAQTGDWPAVSLWTLLNPTCDTSLGDMSTCSQATADSDVVAVSDSLTRGFRYYNASTGTCNNGTASATSPSDCYFAEISLTTCATPTYASIDCVATVPTSVSDLFMSDGTTPKVVCSQVDSKTVRLAFSSNYLATFPVWSDATTPENQANTTQQATTIQAAILHQVVYRNPGDDPSYWQGSLQVTIWDSGSSASGGTTNPPLSSSSNVQKFWNDKVNDAPTCTTSGSLTTYVEQQTVSAFSGLTFTFTDGVDPSTLGCSSTFGGPPENRLAKATVSANDSNLGVLKNSLSCSSINQSSILSALGTCSVDANGLVTLTAANLSGSFSQLQQLLGALQFTHESGDALQSGTVTIYDDGHNYKGTVGAGTVLSADCGSIQLSLCAVNDPPRVTFKNTLPAGKGQVTVTEGQWDQTAGFALFTETDGNDSTQLDLNYATFGFTGVADDTCASGYDSAQKDVLKYVVITAREATSYTDTVGQHVLSCGTLTPSASPVSCTQGSVTSNTGGNLTIDSTDMLSVTLQYSGSQDGDASVQAIEAALLDLVYFNRGTTLCGNCEASTLAFENFTKDSFTGVTTPVGWTIDSALWEANHTYLVLASCGTPALYKDPSVVPAAEVVGYNDPTASAPSCDWSTIEGVDPQAVEAMSLLLSGANAPSSPVTGDTHYDALQLNLNSSSPIATSYSVTLNSPILNAGSGTIRVTFDVVAQIFSPNSSSDGRTVLVHVLNNGSDEVSQVVLTVPTPAGSPAALYQTVSLTQACFTYTSTSSTEQLQFEVQIPAGAVGLGAVLVDNVAFTQGGSCGAPLASLPLSSPYLTASRRLAATSDVLVPLVSTVLPNNPFASSAATRRLAESLGVNVSRRRLSTVTPGDYPTCLVESKDAYWPDATQDWELILNFTMVDTALESSSMDMWKVELKTSNDAPAIDHSATPPIKVWVEDELSQDGKTSDSLDQGRPWAIFGYTNNFREVTIGDIDSCDKINRLEVTFGAYDSANDTTYPGVPAMCPKPTSCTCKPCSTGTCQCLPDDTDPSCTTCPSGFTCGAVSVTPAGAPAIIDAEYCPIKSCSTDFVGGPGPSCPPGRMYIDNTLELANPNSHQKIITNPGTLMCGYDAWLTAFWQALASAQEYSSNPVVRLPSTLPANPAAPSGTSAPSRYLCVCGTAQTPCYCSLDTRCRYVQLADQPGASCAYLTYTDPTTNTTVKWTDQMALAMADSGNTDAHTAMVAARQLVDINVADTEIDSYGTYAAFDATTLRWVPNNLLVANTDYLVCEWLTGFMDDNVVPGDYTTGTDTISGYWGADAKVTLTKRTFTGSGLSSTYLDMTIDEAEKLLMKTDYMNPSNKPRQGIYYVTVELFDDGDQGNDTTQLSAKTTVEFDVTDYNDPNDKGGKYSCSICSCLGPSATGTGTST